MCRRTWAGDLAVVAVWLVARARLHRPGSDNSVFQQLTLDAGPDKVIQTAYDMGIPEERHAFSRRPMFASQFGLFRGPHEGSSKPC